mmetsp:Transcript_163112/g.297499  ORF Transcript_163112/g.297499 Transcript_163112/m.297499 type:complete len:83 (+) Transcript_163112:200-448(+)
MSDSSHDVMSSVPALASLSFLIPSTDANEFADDAEPIVGCCCRSPLEDLLRKWPLEDGLCHAWPAWARQVSKIATNCILAME